MARVKEEKVDGRRGNGARPVNPLLRRQMSGMNLSAYHHYALAQLIQKGVVTRRRRNSGTSDAVAQLIEQAAQEHGISQEGFLKRKDAETYIKGAKT